MSGSAPSGRLTSEVLIKSPRRGVFQDPPASIAIWLSAPLVRRRPPSVATVRLGCYMDCYTGVPCGRENCLADAPDPHVARRLGMRVETVQNWARKGIVLAGSLGSRDGFRTEVGRPARPGRTDGGVGHPRLSGPTTRAEQSCGPEEVPASSGPRSIDRRVRWRLVRPRGSGDQTRKCTHEPHAAQRHARRARGCHSAPAFPGAAGCA